MPGSQEATEDNAAGTAPLAAEQNRLSWPEPLVRGPCVDFLPAPSPGSSHVTHGPLPSIVAIFAARGMTASCKWLSPSGDSNTFQASHHCPYKESFATSPWYELSNCPSRREQTMDLGSEQSGGRMQLLGVYRGEESSPVGLIPSLLPFLRQRKCDSPWTHPQVYPLVVLFSKVALVSW